MKTSSKNQFSFEFFPPRTPEGIDNIRKTVAMLTTLEPDFFSVTFGAGGSTRECTLETVLSMYEWSGVQSVPHVSCMGLTTDEVRTTLEYYKDHNIRHILALRGDLTSGTASSGDFRYASELVEFIRKEFADQFLIDVAAYPECHPQAKSVSQDIDNFYRKVESGADGAITQYFYNVDAYFEFVNRCQQLNIDIPIVPGIMPITNSSRLLRFSENCGAEIPRWIVKRLQEYGDDQHAIFDFGIEVVTHLCQRLLDGGAPGLHFYTMNRAEASVAIWNNLKSHM